MRVILILADGMRPDVLIGNPSVQRCMGRSSYTLKGCTVFPSVTLPCHMSMFHSVDPDRHGTTTNAFAPQVRPIDGLIDLLHKNEKHCGMFYDWEELRDLARPGTLAKSYMVSQECFGYEKTNDMVTRAAIESLQTEQLDFVFIYLSAPDSAGHSYKWMSAEYWKSVQSVWENVDRILEVVSDDDVVIITADHGGHDRTHGTRMPLRYNYDKPEKPRISRVFGYQARFFILFQPEKSSREVVIS